MFPGGEGDRRDGSNVQHVTGGLGLALAGAILQLGSLGSDFYQAEGEQKDAWLGIPHTSDLILLSALVTVALIALTAAGRSPMRGGRVGIAVGIVGLLATFQLGYRMLAPPFGAETTASGLTASCLYYCAPSEAKPAELLLGIGESTLQEIGPVALLLAGFVVSGVWVFRRYGRRSAAPVPDVDREPAGDIDAGARPAGAV